jgi:hypothetical protein
MVAAVYSSDRRRGLARVCECLGRDGDERPGFFIVLYLIKAPIISRLLAHSPSKWRPGFLMFVFWILDAGFSGSCDGIRPNINCQRFGPGR